MNDTDAVASRTAMLDQRILAAGALISAGVMGDLLARWSTDSGGLVALALTSSGYVVLAAIGFASCGPLGRSRIAAWCALIAGVVSFGWGLVVYSTAYSDAESVPLWLNTAALVVVVLGIGVALAGSIAAARSLQGLSAWAWLPAAGFAVQACLVLAHHALPSLFPIDGGANVVWAAFFSVSAVAAVLPSASIGVLTLVYAVRMRGAE